MYQEKIAKIDHQATQVAWTIIMVCVIAMVVIGCLQGILEAREKKG